MADTPPPPSSSFSRYAPWLLIGCVTLVVCSLSVCLVVVTITRAIGPEVLLPLIEGFRSSPVNGPPAANDRNLLLRDEFIDNRNQWTLYQRREAEVSLDRGRLNLMAVGPNGDVRATLPPAFTDFRLEVDSGLLDGPPETGYGLLFRYQDEANFYVFQVDGLGRYRVGKVIQGMYTALIEPTSSDRVQPGQALNRLRVVMVGDKISLAVNGENVGEVKDATFVRGRIGVAVGLTGPGLSRVVFDNLQVYRP